MDSRTGSDTGRDMSRDAVEGRPWVAPSLRGAPQTCPDDAAQSRSALTLFLVSILLLTAVLLLVMFPLAFIGAIDVGTAGIGSSIWWVFVVHVACIILLIRIDPVHTRTVLLIPLLTIVPLWACRALAAVGVHGYVLFWCAALGWMLWALWVLAWHKRGTSPDSGTDVSSA